MTPFEKRNPKVMNASRKKRVAAGSGTKVEEINRLLKMHLQMADMMKQMGRGKGMLGKMFGGKGAPDAAETREDAGRTRQARSQCDPAGTARDDAGRRCARTAETARRACRASAASFPVSAAAWPWRIAGSRRPAVPGLPRIAGKEEMTWRSNLKPNDCACGMARRAMSMPFLCLLSRSAIAGGLWQRHVRAATCGGASRSSRTLAASRLRPLGARGQGNAPIRRLCRPVVSRWLGRCRGRLWHRAGIPRAGLRDEAAAPRARLTAFANWVSNRLVSYINPATMRLDPRRREARRRARKENSSCTASRTWSIATSQPETPITHQGEAKMSLKIRLARAGTKKRPYYHIVVADARPRRATASSSMSSAPSIRCSARPTRSACSSMPRRPASWLKKGAQPTDRVLRFLDKAGLMKREPRNNPRRRCPARSAWSVKRPQADAAAKAAEAADRCCCPAG